MSRNDLDLEYSHIFINSISCLYLPNVRSQAVIVSEKSNVFTFSSYKISPWSKIGHGQPTVVSDKSKF